MRLSSGRCGRAIAGAATAALARQGALTPPACEAAGAALASAARGSLAYGAAKLADVARMATSLPEEAVLREVSQLPRVRLRCAIAGLCMIPILSVVGTAALVCVDGDFRGCWRVPPAAAPLQIDATILNTMTTEQIQK